MLNSALETYMGCGKAYQDAQIVVFGAPFDSTTSNRPGTRFASRTMRSESYGLETYSPYQDLDLIRDTSVCDAGDLELSFGDTERVLDQIEAQTDAILDDKKIPFMIGGEHLVTLGAVRAAYKRYPNLVVVHFDAHTDLRDAYLGVKLSHATVMRRVHELIGDRRIYQFGIRSGEKEEFQFARDHTIMQMFDLSGLESLKSLVLDRPVYLSIDLDVLDPSVFPGTGTPEPGGISYRELQRAIQSVGCLPIVGCDLVELSPPYDPSGISAACACKALRELLLCISQKLTCKEDV